MIYILIAVLAAIVWLATRRITDPVRRFGMAAVVIGLALAVLMWWMAFPFLVIAAIGGVIVGLSYLRERRSA